MAEFTLAPEVDTNLNALGHADLVVGIAAHDRLDDTRDAVAAARAGLAQRFPGISAVVLHAHAGGTHGEPVNGEGGAPVLDLTYRAPGTAGVSLPHAEAVRLILQASQRVGARGAAIIGAEVASLTPEWIGRLLAPVADGEQDFVAPYYLRHPFSGAITSGIVYPLVRCLFGKRVRYPMGAEFAVSSRLIDRHLRRDPRRSPPAHQSVELQLHVDAVAGGMHLTQVALGPRTVVAGDTAAGLSAVLLEVLSQVFGEMEQSTSVWQKIRGSTPVPLAGAVDRAQLEPAPIDRKRLLDAYRLGQQNLREVWGLVHSPGTLVELKKLAQMPEGGFAMPDRLWARIVFDFSLAYRTRVMNRDHLMGALAPLYLGWLGSLDTELGDADPARLEDRLEQLCLQYEAEKPYLISRWRWPDRFNP